MRGKKIIIWNFCSIIVLKIIHLQKNPVNGGTPTILITIIIIIDFIPVDTIVEFKMFFVK